ncbi:unnamed protein product [Nezara viridula]|uniref:Uncharacterized protein n=1 Tax=Nezara viridula TaxID=85310 RepID=A0A9P0E990_NEZVI|nr:unnamed protein product [Nezara viridula]
MKVMKKMINIWTKLEFMPEERLPKLCFNRLKSLDKDKPDIDFNWVPQFRAIAELNAFAEELSVHPKKRTSSTQRRYPSKSTQLLFLSRHTKNLKLHELPFIQNAMQLQCSRS